MFHNLPKISGFTWEMLYMVSSEPTHVITIIWSLNLVSILMSRSSDEIVGIIAGLPGIRDGYICMFDSSELLKLVVGKKFLSLHMV